MDSTMPAQLLALNSGPNILLDKPILLLGRHPECDIQIDSRKISRRHCCIAQVSDYLVVRDLGSTNGIRINGERVLEGRLAAGDELTIGNHRYQVTWDAVPAEPPRARMTRETGRVPAAPGNVEDELLESCDDPVPLGEPGAPRRRPVPPPLPGKLDLDASEAMSVDGSMILPEKLELSPQSGPLPGLPTPPSKSRPPV
jgi:predicted component of type VI protein secretion system